ncbi:hypothetical protein MKZ38_005716 [Zalerion maritima]|uniref:Uncharacterized protein n=1 Tax=Zalerion maritima TaxID=339359 RepID=A0AAD5WP43_9PEZI|nr:hypothetical protein MKZ38_005716 [Zalerion maritima]
MRPEEEAEQLPEPNIPPLPSSIFLLVLHEHDSQKDSPHDHLHPPISLSHPAGGTAAERIQNLPDGDRDLAHAVHQPRRNRRFFASHPASILHAGSELCFKLVVAFPVVDAALDGAGAGGAARGEGREELRIAQDLVSAGPPKRERNEVSRERI